MRKQINKGRRNPIQKDGPASKRRKISGKVYQGASEKNGRVEYEPRKIVSEEQRWEIFDWEGKMEKYRRELEEEEKARKERKEKSEKMEKGWELMRICREYIETNGRKWEDEEKM